MDEDCCLPILTDFHPSSENCFSYYYLPDSRYLNTIAEFLVHAPHTHVCASTFWAFLMDMIICFVPLVDHSLTVMCLVRPFFSFHFLKEVVQSLTFSTFSFEMYQLQWLNLLWKIKIFPYTAGRQSNWSAQFFCLAFVNGFTKNTVKPQCFV